LEKAHRLKPVLLKSKNASEDAGAKVKPESSSDYCDEWLRVCQGNSLAIVMGSYFLATSHLISL
jgi:hypothetical protein